MPDVICPSCGRTKAVTDDVFASIAGKAVRCSGCKADFVIEEQNPFDFLDVPVVTALPVTPQPISQPTPQQSKTEDKPIADADAMAAATPKIPPPAPRTWSSWWEGLGCVTNILGIVCGLAIATELTVYGLWAGASLFGLGVVIRLLSKIEERLSELVERADGKPLE